MEGMIFQARSNTPVVNDRQQQ